MLIDGFRYRNSSSGGNPSSGIGKATVRLFVDHVCLVVVIANVQDELGQRVAASIGTDRCIYIHYDITNEDQVKSMVERMVHSYGHLDIMFSNAGIFNNHQGILDLDLTACDHLFAVNVWGIAACVKHAAQSMVDTGVKGSIVCMVSMVATNGAENYTDYVMSKHAVLGLVRSANRYLGKHGIRVNYVSLSALATPMSIN